MTIMNADVIIQRLLKLISDLGQKIDSGVKSLYKGF